MSKSRRLLWAERKSKSLCVYCGLVPPQKHSIGCSACLAKKVKATARFIKENNKATKQYRLRIKHDVIKKYGGKCQCCSEDKLAFLTIDHIHNDGYIDRQDSSSSNSFYLKLRREDVRLDLQVLCFNCNLGKQVNGGICPHKQNNLIMLPQTDGRRKSVLGKLEKIVWPEDSVLIEMCKQSSCQQVAKKLGVHNTAIRGRLKRRNLYHLVKHERTKTEDTSTISG